MARRPTNWPTTPRLTDEVVWRTHNPWDLASNLEAMTLAIRTGNGSPGPLDEGGLPFDLIEAGCRDMSASLHTRLTELGYEHVYDDYGPGTHSWPYWARDLRLELPRIMATFRDPPPRPRAFTYTTAEPRFSVYRWKVTRPDGGFGFAELADASRRGFAYSGPGPARVVTAPVFRPRSRHTVTTDDGETIVRAGRRGRLRFSVGPQAVVRIS